MAWIHVPRDFLHPAPQLSDKSLCAALKSELSGNLLLACTAVVDYAVNATDYVVTRMYNTMKGWGTHDWALINFVVEHCEVFYPMHLGSHSQLLCLPLCPVP